MLSVDFPLGLWESTLERDFVLWIVLAGDTRQPQEEDVRLLSVN